jgi:hypothetical protein
MRDAILLRITHLLDPQSMRTTLDIADPVLKQLKRLGKAEGKAVGTLASELLAQALAKRQSAKAAPAFRWISRPMGARIDLADKDAVLDALNERP